MSTTSGDQILPYYFNAAKMFPLLGTVTPVIDPDQEGPADGEGKLDVDGRPHFWLRINYPPKIIGPTLFKEWLDDICGHELGHPYEKLVIKFLQKKNGWTEQQASVYVHKMYWDFRKFAATWEQKKAEADAMGWQVGWQFDPGESWAEAFKAAFLGRWPITPGHTVGAEKTYNEGKEADPMALRKFFLGLTEEVAVVTDLPFVDLPVANNNFWAGRGVKIDTIILHSMAGTWQSANSRFNNPAAQVSAHRGICYDGIMRRWVEDEFTAYANGVWSVNIRALTIEVEDMGDSWGVRPDIVYSMCGAQVAEWVQKHSISLDRYHVVPGVAVHKDVYNTACPAALDTDRIIWIARRIIGGIDPVSPFDPKTNAEDAKWLDDRYASKPDVANTINSMKKVYDPVAAWAAGAPRPAVGASGAHIADSLKVGEDKPNLEPHDNMKGEPPTGHPANHPRTGTHQKGGS